MEDELDLPENKLRDFIQHSNKEKWRCDNNHNIKYFTKAEIRAITNNYNTKIGSGAFGDVYRGNLRDGHPVAVKRNNRATTKEEFAKEVITHSQINHKNVVRLLGCCTEGNAQMMVFEHVPKGNLSDHLHHADAIMPLETRLNIAIECAEALWCMHSMYRPVLHGDIKPDNILLDDNFHAKVSDFGLARLLSAGSNTDRATIVKGSVGYMDPTFREEGCLSPKVDVYSLGVVLVELVTKKKPTDNNDVVQIFARFSAKTKTLRELFDPDITNAGSIKVLEGIGKIAKECLHEKIDGRPEMKVVAARLWELRATLEQGKEKALKRGGRRDTNNVATRSSLSEPNSMKNTGDITVFTYKEIRKMTQNFEPSICTEYSSIYLGVLPDNTRVAVKELRTAKKEGVNELTIHSQMQHSNIVKVVGCCLEKYSPILVTEYVPNGSLGEYLLVKAKGTRESTAKKHDRTRSHVRSRHLLDLNICYQIALGVASAMAYLHEGRQEWVLHCDIKPESILLDDHFRPKVCNFGLSKMMSMHDKVVTVSDIREKLNRQRDHHRSETCLTTSSTVGYLAPEWFRSSEAITAKADVYSFGMVLLEMVSGRRKRESFRDPGDSMLWYWPKEHVEFLLQSYIDDILDPRVMTAYYSNKTNLAIVKRMIKTALRCLQYSAEERPSMGEVTKMLEGTVDITEPVRPTFWGMKSMQA